MTTTTESFEKGITRGVNILTGDPRIAIRKLSGPMIVAMLLMAIYNLADAVWVAGLGADALAAVGFVMPVFMILIALSNGIGAGATSTVARRIGAKDKAGAESGAMHAIMLSLLIAAILTPVLALSVEPITVLLGAGSFASLAAEYGTIVFSGSIFFLFAQVCYAILRAEGDTKRTMYAMAASSILNIILDPILIYGAGLGVAGAAIATVISIASVSMVLLYWFLVKQDTFLTLSWKGFRPERHTLRDILAVGLPAGVEHLLMSIVAIVNNTILVMVGGSEAVAVYTSGWRIVMFAVVPLIGIATSLVSVAGAAYGGRHYHKLDVAHRYSASLGVGIAGLTGALTWTFAPQITGLFTYTAESAHLAPGLILFFHTMCFFFPFASLGIMSSAVFQGTGRGTTSLVISLLRNLVFIAVFSPLLALVLGLGEFGVYLGIVIGSILGGSIGYLWARLFIRRLNASAEAETAG